MGGWGGGLYDSDFGLDLKATIKVVWRAPLAEDDLLAEIRASVGERVEGMDSLDYWLVLADQLERRGMPRRDVFERAIAIVETGEDVAMLEELGAAPRAIAERRGPKFVFPPPSGQPLDPGEPDQRPGPHDPS